MKGVFSFLVCCIYIISANAQAELDPVTVTATLHPVSSSATGRNIIVIKAEQLSNMPANSIDELLRYFPGIEVQMRGPMGAQSDFVVRGGTFQQVLVVLDGIRLNDPNTGHFSSYIPIAPSEIDRIELLKGASSAIYGSEAVGGVIHIITKTFSAKQDQKDKQFIAQGVIGEYALVNGQLGAFSNNGSTALAAGIVSNNSGGQALRGARGYFYNNTASFSVNHFINNKLNFALRSSYDSRDFAAQNFYTTFVSDTATEKVTTLWNHVKLTYNTQKHLFTFNAGYKEVKDVFLYNRASTPNKNKSSLLQGLAIYKWQASSHTSVTMGANWLNKTIKSNDRGNHNLDQVATFAMLNQTVGRSFHIDPAIRVQWNERSGWNVIPQLNLSYKLLQWQLRASAGKTTRDADFTERFNNYNKKLVTGGSIGNPDLVAEHSGSYEAGIDYFGTPNLKISGTFFQRHFSNLIDFVVTPYSQMPRKENLSPAGTYALAKNISKLTSTGFETDVQYSGTPGSNQQLIITSGLTWLNTKGANAMSFYINSHAKFLANFNIFYSIGRFSISTNGIYKKRQRRSAPAIRAEIEDDYFLFNLRLQSFVYKKNVSLFTQLDNCLLYTSPSPRDS